MNEWMNEWMSEWVSEWMNECMHACMPEWMNEWMNKMNRKSYGISSVKAITNAMRSFAALCYVMSCYAILFHPPSYPILFHSILSFDKLSASLIISDLAICFVFYYVPCCSALVYRLFCCVNYYSFAYTTTWEMSAVWLASILIWSTYKWKVRTFCGQ